MIVEVYPMKSRKSFYEQNGGKYTQVSDVLFPGRSVGEAKQSPAGKYGRMRKQYLKEPRPIRSCPARCTGIRLRSTTPVRIVWS